MHTYNNIYTIVYTILYYKHTIELTSIKQYYLTIYLGVYVVGLFVDPVEQKLYFTDYERKTLEVANVDGSERKTLATSSAHMKGVTLDHNKG